MSEVAFLPASELSGLYRSRKLSPLEAAEAALSRIEQSNARVNAYCLVDAEHALSQARKSEERYSKGESVGRLDGVPTSIKDNFLTRGWPTLRGSHAIDPDQAWHDDAPVVARLREHGAVLLGKTTTPEYAWKGVTHSPLTGFTGNPWAPTRTAGGSSGGAAAAVALGMGQLAVGSDGAGSLRIPAGFCGIVTLKPTYGRIPLWPASPFGTLSHAGPLTRTVADAALMLDALAVPDARDWTSLPPEDFDYLDAIEGGVEGLRIAFSPDLGYVEVEPEIREAVDAAIRVFEDMGARVEEKDPGFEDPIEILDIHWNAGAAIALRAYDEKTRELMDPVLIEIANRGASYSVMEYLEAVARRNELGIRMSTFHTEYDLLLTPTLPIPAFEGVREVPEGWGHESWMSWTPFTYPFNLTQQPAASVPCGFTSSGLPIGLQIVGAKYEDALVLRAAHAYQSTRPLTDRRPPEFGGEGA
jgi:aspartyl-tRNA(Asn)/glutamyl-tRNA(Gln) amidotransferase subunit A